MVADETVFALKGGTAINLFVRDMGWPLETGGVRLNASQKAVVLPQGVRAMLGGASPRVKPMKAEDIDRALMWREGKLAFEDESLAEAARSFARYGGPPLLITDTALAAEPVTGLFAANASQGFSQAIALALGAEVLVRPDGLMISGTVRAKVS